VILDVMLQGLKTLQLAEASDNPKVPVIS